MKVAVGLSGGVDSSVAAYLLKEQGHDVVALFMQNWHDSTGTLHGDCEWEEERAIAELVARKIGIPFEFVDLSYEYSKRVVDYMFDEYSKGRTPNPDVLCNREIKFDVFLKVALKLGVDYVATGHYCQKESFINEQGVEIHRLIAGADPNKDQSYFLCQLSQDQLSKTIFPIGHLLKPNVREIAASAGLPSASKKDSQGICFVGKVDLPVFLQQKLVPIQGTVIEISNDYYNSIEKKSFNNFEDQIRFESLPFRYTQIDGKIAGIHNGAQFYTIGQRRGLNIGGHKESIFVISTDIQNNIIYVGEGQDHPGLFRKSLFIRNYDIHFIREDLKMEIGESREMLVRIRYRQALQKAILYKFEDGIYIRFEQLQRGVTPGQFAAWYSGEELIGSGVINE